MRLSAAALRWLTLAARFAPRLFRIRRRTWAAIAIGLVLLFVAIVWAALALLGWLWTQVSGALQGAPQALRETAQRAEKALPGIREDAAQRADAVLGRAETARDVSGSDLGPVNRFPGMARTHWQRDATTASVEYRGRADYQAVLDHYVRGFAPQGYAQTVDAASPNGERHRYRKDNDVVALAIERVDGGDVKVRLETRVPN
jgi:hypothetical protein